MGRSVAADFGVEDRVGDNRMPKVLADGAVDEESFGYLSCVGEPLVAGRSRGA